ncbi:tetratricopeptide repeat protein [Chitinophaga sp. Cy-1792]|uniref:tetratricopeptide repeat protein n=1 Tax=Chitinophaga sp. Cy-1792 TaxID=2608339 RepID=UPI0014222B62|nr:tetratricopeptide repeat protein [Chitinophaga sp. Cy-1792]NIG54532.1 tetratricopeptide repeat protein [Chitinophaga sp. Cy-1792]
MSGKYFIAGLCLLCCSCMFKSSKDYLKEAAAFEAQNKLEEAIGVLDKAIEANPKFLPAYLNRGADLSRLGKHDLAIQNYTAVIRLSPNNVLALVNRGQNEFSLGQYRKALDDFQAAIRHKGGEKFYIDLNPNSIVDVGQGYDVPMVVIRLDRGLVYYNLDSLNSAFRDFQFCIGQQYELGMAYRLSAYVYLRAGQKEAGCQHLQQAVARGDAEAKEAQAKYCQ